MSTKTLRKRIALVAVSALGFGLITVAPANAANSATTISASAVFQGGADVTISSTVSANDKTAYVFTVSPNGFAPGDDDSTYGGATAGEDIPGGINGGGLSVIGSGTIGTAGTTARIVIPNSMLLPGRYTVKLGADTTDAAADTEAAGSDAGDTVSFTVLPALAAGAVAGAADAPFYTLTASTDATATIVVSKPAGTGAVRARVLTAPATAVEFIPGYAGSGFTITDLVGSGSAATGSTVGLAINGTAGTDKLSVAGTYGIQIWADSNADGAFTTGEIATTVSLTFGGAATATGSSISLSRSLTANTDNNSAGSVGVSNTETLGNAAGTLDNFRVTVTCADTLGNPATCTPTIYEDTDESNIGASGSATSMTRVGNTNTYIYDATISSAGDSTAGFTDVVVTLALSSTATTKTATYRNVYLADAITQIEAVDAVGIGTVGALGKEDLFEAGVTSTAALPAVEAITVDKAVTSITYNVTAPAAQAGRYIITLRSPGAVGTSLTTAPAAVSIRRLGSDAKASWAEAVTGAAADVYAIRVLGGTSGTGGAGTGNAGIEVTFATATPAITVTPTATVLAKDGATTSFAGVLTDQFGRAIAAGTVIWSVAGRNPATGSVVTAANGAIPAVTVVDASKIVTAAATTTTAATVNTDTITFTYNYTTSTGAAAVATGSRGVTYSLTGPSVATVAVASATTTQQIDQAKVAGTPARTVLYTATVRKADSTSSGAGILCTWAGAAGDLFLNGITTSVTDADGLCTIRAFRDLVGSSAITATAVGVTSAASSPVRWVNQADIATNTNEHDGRYIAVTAGTAVAGTPVTVLATITDRWGNPVNGVDVTFAISGVGRLVAGDSTAKKTNVNGQAQIQVVASDNETGTNTVSASFAGSQALDIAGFVTVNNTSTPGTAAAGDTQTSTAVTGATAAVRSASATVTFTKNTATSTADALLALATALGTREQASAAVDAAAEATDAANAATDAANAAAEAADAATAAAQDAADAVAALSTQVSEMVAALKKQITSLTNLVIKIQKKVKA